jgi:hypothetical protein
MAKPKATTTTPRRAIRCYLCGHVFDVSSMTMSVPCPRCNKALKVEDVHVKTYVPVNDLQTCGKITVAKNGRVVARVIRAGEGIDCDGTLEGAIEADDRIVLTDKSTWKGKTLMTRALVVESGAKLHGHVKVPWVRPIPPPTATTPPTTARKPGTASGAKSTTEVKPLAERVEAEEVDSPSMP